jgi:hypothetical protein
MSTSASTQTVLTIVKDEFAEVLTKGTLFPATKPTDWNALSPKKPCWKLRGRLPLPLKKFDMV